MRSAFAWRLLTGAATICFACSAQADSLWDEVNNGELSNDGLSPTMLSMSLGSNIVLGTTGNAGQGIDRDYFTFDVPTGALLASITVLSNTSVSGGSSFIALQAGPQITVLSSGAGAQDLMGYTHYGNDLIGSDLLTFLAASSGVLMAGTYSIWVQETGGPATYGFDFAITPVPLPGAAFLLLSGLAGAAGFRRRARSLNERP